MVWDAKTVRLIEEIFKNNSICITTIGFLKEGAS